jgi:ABC-type Co2+ transport system permease subunit
MHIPDGFLSGEVAATATNAAVTPSSGTRRSSGTSGHFLGGALAALLLGP